VASTPPPFQRLYLSDGSTYRAEILHLFLKHIDVSVGRKSEFSEMVRMGAPVELAWNDPLI